jgi:UDP-N-acetylglucosamine--N-acetylmuramyl-(pentapeptide) pyrophosphoryl-undecaprenol N-acetylglucosamine transferase
LLVVTGGSQGSQVINQVIDQLLPQLLTEWCVVHQRGEQANDRVPHAVGWYFPRVWLTDTELFWLWRQTACLTISRAGANTICELAVLRVPAILIPLPFAYQDEQKMNARWLADQGGAIVLEQAELTPAKLSSALRQLAKQATQMRAALGTTDLPLDGAERLWAVIQNQL